MRAVRCLLAGVVACAGLAPALAAEGKGVLAPGKNLPGPFSPYNVTPAPVEAPPPAAKDEDPDSKTRFKEKPYGSKGKFHDLVTQFDTDPVVMLVARGVGDNAAFKDLLKQLDAAAGRHARDRLRAFVVFLHDDLTDVVKEDDKRGKYAKAAADLAAELKLQHVVLCLGDKPMLKAYALDDKAALTAVLYKKLKIEASAVEGKVDAAVGKAVADAAAKLVPAR